MIGSKARISEKPINDIIIAAELVAREATSTAAPPPETDPETAS